MSVYIPEEGSVTTTQHDYSLSVEDRALFLEQGFIILRDIVPSEVLQRLREVFDGQVERLAQTWRTEGLVADTHDDLPFETRFAALRTQLPARFPTTWRKALVNQTVYELWQRPELLGPIRSLVGDEVYAHGIWNGRPREPHTAIQRILWHQDAHYYKGWDANDGKLISVWMPLVPVDAPSGCLQLLQGSNHRGYIDRIRGVNGLFTVADDQLRDHPLVTATMSPGDALFFTDLTLHQALPNEADYVRWSIDIRFGSATPEIIRKTPRGYYCYSAADRARVETFDTWKGRYDYSEVGLEAELDNVDEADLAGLAEAARTMHISPSELDVF